MPAARYALTLALALVVAACGSGVADDSGSAPPGAGGTPAQPSMTDAPATGEPAATEAPPTDAPTGEPTNAPTEEPATDAPTAGPAEASATPDPSAAAASAAACSGSDANRSFFAAAAGAVDWPVLCAVLPKGWFVAEGSYRKANGGKLLISYKGPSGATLALSEGSFCSGSDGCVPAGDDLGSADLGSLGGTLVGLDDGGLAIVVDRGRSPSWLMVTQGLDQAATLALGAALAEVAR